MRVSNAAISRQLIYEISRNYDRMNLYRLQVASGKRINDFDDNPRAVGMLKRFDALQANNAQYERNVGAARTYLEATDFALQDMSGLMSDLRELVMTELGPISNPQSRNAAVAAAEGMREQMLSLANQQVEGSYLFAGYRTDAQPFSLVNGEVYYNGDSNSQSVQVGPTLRLDVTTPGDNFMGTDSATLGGTTELSPRVRPTTLLADLNGGNGIAGGRIQITAGVDLPVNIDLSGATTVQDVLDTINASGGSFTASISPDEIGITITGPEPIAVGEVLGGSTAGDLGILGTTESTTLRGTDIQPRLTALTDFSEIRALDGNLPLGTLRIVRAGEVTDIDLSGANSIGDVRTAVQSVIPDMDVDIDEGTLVLTYNQPESFSVESPQGDQTASVLGLSGETSPTRTFDLFADIIAALESDDSQALRQSLVELTDVHANISSLNVTVGSRQRTLDQSESLLRERNESLQLQRSRVEDVDLINVATRLTFAETTYQAALATAARVFDMSLLNYL